MKRRQLSRREMIEMCIIRGLPAHVVLWDAALGKPLRTIRLPHSANQVAFSPDETLVAVANLAGGVRLWQLSELVGQRRGRT